MKTALLSLLALLLASGASAAAPPGVEPQQVAPGGLITVSGPPGPVTLEPLDVPGPAVAVGTIAAGGSVEVRVPELEPGRYRVVTVGSSEAPILEVTERLDGRTSGLLIAFGLLLILGLATAGLVVHRRWRDAIG